MVRVGRSSSTRPLLLLVALAVGTVSTPAAEDANAQAGEETAASETSVSLGSRWSVSLFPRTDLYPVYIADPHRVGFGAERLDVSDSQIPNTGSPRFGLKLGGRFGLLRIHPKDDPERGVQANLEVGFIGQFDSSNSTDNIGWDGIYALTISYRPKGRVQYRLGLHHTSSHVGDEYMQRTGRMRINYTREEWLVGASTPFGERWRAYGEAAYAFDMRNEAIQEPGRVQAGVQYERDDSLWRRRLGWYAALDGTAFEERDWQVNSTVQAGIKLGSANRTWRAGIQYYDGRSLVGEFFQADERYLSLGVWLDL